MATGQVRTTEELMAPPIKTTEELLKKKQDIPTQKKEVVKPPWYDNYLGLIRPILGGVQAGTAAGMKSLIKAADFISDKLGIPKSDAARMIAGDLEKFSQANKAKGVGGAVGDIASGLGEAVPAIASMMIMGPAGLPVHGAVLGGIEGGVQGALTGAASGALSHGVLKGMGGLATPARVGAGAVFGAATTPGGIEERAKGAAVMGGLSFAGGRPQRQVVDMRGKPAAGKIITTPAEGKTVAEVATQKSASDVFMEAMKGLPKLRALQNALNAEERSVRIPAAIEAGKTTMGEAGWKAQKGALSGEFKKAEYEGLRNALGKTPEERQTVVDGLFQQIQDSASISETQKIPTKNGLEGLINRGKIPQEAQLAHMNSVFGDEFVRTIMRERGTFEKMKELGIEVANVPRAIMASTDLSFGLRQGLMIATRHPAIFWGGWAHQFTKGGTESFKAAKEAIVARKTYRLMDKFGVALTDVGEIVKGREENYASPLAEKIPGIGKVVGWSSRVYTAFANQLRADTFDYYVKRATDMGRDLWSNNFKEWTHKKGLATVGMPPERVEELRIQWGKDVKLGHDIAKIVNNGTGRGTFGKRMEDLAPALNALMFSPRLFASRFNTLLNPVYYMKLDPFARKAQLKMTASMVGTGMTTLALLGAAGIKVGTNPTSPDFGKIEAGNTRIDIWGGYQQYAVLFARILAGKTTSSVTGKATSLNTGAYGKPSRLSVLGNFFQGKLSPIPSFVTALLRGSNVMGEKFDITKGFDEKLSSFDWMKNPVASMFIPMVIQDFADIAKDDPGLIPASALGVFGVGLQTYSKKNKKRKTIR